MMFLYKFSWLPCSSVSYGMFCRRVLSWKRPVCVYSLGSEVLMTVVRRVEAVVWWDYWDSRIVCDRRTYTIQHGNFIVRNWFIGTSSAKYAVKTDLEAVLCLFPTGDTEFLSPIRFDFSPCHTVYRTSRILSGGFRRLYGNTRPELGPDRLCPPSVDEECVPLCRHSVFYALIIYYVRHEHLWFMVSPCCRFCSFSSQCVQVCLGQPMVLKHFISHSVHNSAV